MNIEVTSVSKSSEKLSKAPAAIYVLREQDIRRSGATSIPESLRMVPGVEVARMDTHQWAITSRGFNDIFANKLLVTMDGRSVYTPLFSGVFWNAQDYLLEDLDRIEVVRGPGADLWGANAVNGVINIYSKSARETQGMLVSGGGGTEQVGFGALRYGGRLSDKAWYRVYAKYFNEDGLALPNGTPAHDGWDMARGGFRADWEPHEGTEATFQGDIYSGWIHQSWTTATPIGTAATVHGTTLSRGGNLIGRWKRELSDDARLEIQAYYDHMDWRTVLGSERRDNGDVSAQHQFTTGRHEWTSGLEYRVSDDNFKGTFDLGLAPASRTTQLFSGFLRDKITLQEDRWWLLVGTELEHNDFSGFEVQPSGRLLWTPHDRHTLWAAVSRSVRTPSRAEESITINRPGPVPGSLVRIAGSTAMDAEDELSYQLGHRMQLGDRVTTDLALFYNEYDCLRSLEPTGVAPGPPVVATLTAANGLKGETYGIEFAPRWHVAKNWRLEGSYSYLQVQLHNKPGSADTTSLTREGQSPHHQFKFRSALELPGNIDLDGILRYVDALPALGLSSYVEMDVRIAWRPRPDLELSFAGQNLLDNQHPEFSPTFIGTVPSEVQRGFYAKLTWRF